MISNAVLNLFNNPKNAGRISKPDGIADLYNEDNTSHVEFSLRIESGVITECKFRAQANPYIIAICSTITTMVKGKMVSMLFLDPYSIKKELGDESPINIDFCIDCLKNAVVDYKEKLEKENKGKNKVEQPEIVEEIEEKEEVEETEANEQPIAIQQEQKQEKLQDDEDDDFNFSDFFDDIDI
ncbi:MAG: iron-sulfur cluster assembly scaffold protein [Clostridia bacterium]|nr:iron-sulfur cluster assembly scaffold protein [Clostridia bacterium]